MDTKVTQIDSSADERGSVIVLIVLFLIVVLVFAALALDTTFNLTQRGEIQWLTRQVSLGAIEVIQDRGPSDTDPIIWARARDRAEMLAQDNMDRMVGQLARRGTLADMNTIGVKKANNSWYQDSSANDLDGDSGWMQSGNWFFDAQPPESNPCGLGSLFKPCFVPVDPDGGGNALKLHLNLAPTTRLQQLFGRMLFLNSPGLELKSEAVAAIVPRYLITLLDVSGSVVNESHFGATFPTRGRFVYRDNEDDSSVTIGGVTYPGWNSLAANRAGDTDGANYYQDDYVRIVLPSDSEYGAIAGEAFRVDNFFYRNISGATNVAQRMPRPLNVVLDGIKSTLDFFVERNISADRIGIFGFDDQANGASIYNRGSWIDDSGLKYTMHKPDATDSGFQRLLNAVDTSVGYESSFGVPRDSRLQPMLLPQNKGSTDIPYSVGIGLKMLKHAGKQSKARRSLLIVSDGGTICIPQTCFGDCNVVLATPGSPPPAYSPVSGCLTCLENNVADPSNSTQVDAFLAKLSENRRCGGAYNYGNSVLGASVDEFRKLFDDPTDYLRSMDLQVSVFLLGASFGTHELVYAKDPTGGGCLNQQEMIDAGFPITNYNGNSPTGESYYPTAMADAVKNTGGVWAAIRQPCPSDVTAQLTAACNAASAAVGFVPSQPVDLVTHLNCGSTPTALCAFVDANGRLMCDPLGETESVQYQRYLNRILGQDNPFMLVKDGLL